MTQSLKKKNTDDIYINDVYTYVIVGLLLMFLSAANLEKVVVLLNLAKTGK